MTEKEALLKMELYCSTAEHCIYDVCKKLDNCELLKEEVDRVINKLQQQGYVDESRYAAAFVHDKLFFAKWG
ncbi:MAG: RecX family transcriptional regulator, partial [Bacteroidaceae bacterium]|nr:RecX family transcriptional regulator [Bacteroidaceae bacterium]